MNKKKNKPIEENGQKALEVHKRTVDIWIKEIRIKTRCHSLHVIFAKVKKKSRNGK